MRRSWTIARLGLVSSCWMSHFCTASTMEFHSVSRGTRYGGDFGNSPGGSAVLVEDGIEMGVDSFLNTNLNFTGFVRAEVGGLFADEFPTTPLELDSISTVFGFTGLGFDVTQASFEYIEFGIHYNFAVNGGAIHEVATLAALPANIAPGILLALEELDAGTHRMRLTLAGEVDSFLIGADELAIDTIVAVPDPTSLLLLGAGAICALPRFRRMALVR